MHELRILLSGENTNVIPTIDKIVDYCELVGFDKNTRFRIQVVVTEAINNIIAYATPASPVTISCLFNDMEQALIIDIIDNGAPIVKTPLFDFPESEAESGRGWPIIFYWMDYVSHVRQGDENHLTMKKNLT